MSLVGNRAVNAPFEQYSDEELCCMAQNDCREAEGELAKRYHRLVRVCARPLFLAGGENEDLQQEGMFGLIKAIRSFDPQRNSSFFTFAETCIQNHLYSVLKSASSGKNALLNQAIPLQPSFLETNFSFAQVDPEFLIIDREKAAAILSSARKLLSDFEGKILSYYLDGLTCREIAQTVGKPPKSVENAVQRIRRKLSGDFLPAISAKAERNIFFSQREGKIMYEDKTLVCKECGKEFVFTAGEQEFYAERGFQNEPQRCKACRDARKNAARGPREYFTAVCAACGGEAKVPFEPKTDRPVYCSDCFAKMRENG